MNPVVTRHEADGRLIYAHVLCYGRNVTTIACCTLLDSINHVMSLPSEILAERSNSSDFIPLLPAKAYIPPSPAQAPTDSKNPLIHAHVGL